MLNFFELYTVAAHFYLVVNTAQAYNIAVFLKFA